MVTNRLETAFYGCWFRGNGVTTGISAADRAQTVLSLQIRTQNHMI
jgi:3,4-dihydroxy-2-butanone 4-phosphate synthase